MQLSSLTDVRWLPALAMLISTAALSAAELDRYGGTTAIKGKATGFFHIEQIDDEIGHHAGRQRVLRRCFKPHAIG